MYVCKLGDSDCRKHFVYKAFDRSMYSTLCYNLDICHKMLPVGSSTAYQDGFLQFSKFVAQIFSEILASF